MAVVTDTFLSYDAKGNREDLTDIIYDVSPTKTPFMSNAGRSTAKSVLHEWQMDALAAAADNKHLQGDETTFAAVTPTIRVGNYTQIAKKAVIISGTQEVVDHAGRNSELGYQLAKLGKEMKRDMEVTLLSNKAGVGGATATIPELAGLPVWIKTNDVVNGGGASAVWTSGVPGAARTDGTQAAFTEAMLQSAVRLVFNSGGDPTTLMVGPFNKQKVSSFAGISTLTYNMSTPVAGAIIGAADVYKHDFGLLTVVPNRFQRERDAFLLDFDLVSVAYLRGFFQEELAKTGDAHKRHMIAEFTLQVKNEAGLGGIFDLTVS